MTATSFRLFDDAAWIRFREAMTSRPDACKRLANDADAWLKAAPVSIVPGKKHLAPSGDPHDYISIGPYWWPDPAKPDGLPWIVRDGEVNPVFYEYDNRRLETFCQAVTHLILHVVVTGSDAHARAAGRYFRTWFLDEATRMNPHLTYAQFVPGRTDGRGIGIIDTTSLVFVLNALPLLPFNEEWTQRDLTSVQDWFSHYLNWLLTSKNGKDEASEHNNHGTWFDVQASTYAFFCGRSEVARKIMATTARDRLSSQIKPDGSMPHELARTLSLTYCTYNLLGFACLAEMARKSGDDLWRWKTASGTSLLSAVKWMQPYYSGKVPWTHKQLKPFDFGAASPLLTLTGQGTADSSWYDLSAKLASQPWQTINFSKADLSGRKAPAPGELPPT